MKKIIDFLFDVWSFFATVMMLVSWAEVALRPIILSIAEMFWGWAPPTPASTNDIYIRGAFWTAAGGLALILHKLEEDDNA